MRKDLALLLISGISVVAFGLGLFIGVNPGPGKGLDPGTALIAPVQGAADAPIRILEFSDFQCPFCARGAMVTMNALKKHYGGKISIEFRQFPLRMHPMAEPAARASLAAGLQGKFWDMHDLLFKNSRELSQERFVAMARQLGLDVDRFRWDLEDSRLGDRIREDQALATALGVSGTPAFLINGKMVVGARPVEEFIAIIDQQLVQAEAGRAKGLAGKELHRFLAQGNQASPAYLKHVVDGEPLPQAKPEKAAATGEKKGGGDALGGEVWKVRVDPENPSMGPTNAPLTLVIFSDFQCPFCSRIGSLVEEAKEAYGDELRVVFKHNPLSFHKQAFPAAEASLAAAEQGMFWQMHDMLFNYQKDLSLSAFENYARQLGLNMDQYVDAMNSHKFKARILQDIEDGAAVGVKGTPSLFLNGRTLKPAGSLSEIRAELDRELEKARKIRDQGNKDVYGFLTNGGKVFTPLDDSVYKFSNEGSPARGAGPGAAIELTIFSDFQCPYCSRINPSLEGVLEHYQGKARLVFRQFPLSFHKQARPAALASLAAGKQGKFWEMHDLLFQNQKELGDEALDNFARTLGLDMEKFAKDKADPALAQVIDDDMTEGSAAGVRGTPSFFINGRKYQAAGRTVEDIVRVIDTQILGEQARRNQP